MREESSRIRARLQAIKKRKNSKPPKANSKVTQGENPVAEGSDETVEGIWNLHGERPPPSSIAARKDTLEARKLAHVLDEHYTKLSTLHLWADVHELGAISGGRSPRHDSDDVQTAPSSEKEPSIPEGEGEEGSEVEAQAKVGATS